MSPAADPSTGGAGEWAELALIVLEPAQRAPGLPPDTAATPLAARVKGFLETGARIGEAATVRTLSGRRVEGTLLRIAPASGHSFGEPQPGLLGIGPELRSFLAASSELVSE